ncbi:MAG: hydantoinase B/oxoprolinase family protein [Alphaproteobacteria bacterium]|nr:hydantoinase B/oxoprolinase family protein [Alphaproteobacteria bacterium]
MEPDGVQLALLANRLDGVVRKMANTLLRTGRSGVLNTARDFSCCIVTADHQLLTATESLPIHVLSGPDIMARSMAEFHPELKRGDAFLHNSPYHGCSHPADHTILVPVVDNSGRHRFTVEAKAHQADIGNSIPTTYHARARDVYEEGALIFPAVRVQRDYENIEDIVRMCRLRIRVPDQWWGDYLAMVGAARIGERELTALGEEAGWDALEAFAGRFFDYSESRMDAALRELPAGEAGHSSTHDPIPGTPEEGVTINVSVRTDPDAGRVAVDLRDNPDAMPCGLNLSEACARTAAMVGVFNSIDHTVPKNAGSFRRIDVHLRENCVVGIPKHPTSCSAATTNVADRVSNSVQASMAKISEDVGLAECGASSPPAAAVVSGTNPETGKDYVNQVFLGRTNGAASAHTDAWWTVGHVGNAGMCFLDSVELDELRLPIYVHARGFVPDSEGAGRMCGAPQGFAVFGPRAGRMSLIYNSDGTINGPKGVRGGLGAANAGQHKLSANGNEEEVPRVGQVYLEPGELMVSRSCGGGGYGPPAERDPERVAWQVAEGFLSVDRARDVYAVAVDPDGAVRADETARLRAEVE